MSFVPTVPTALMTTPSDAARTPLVLLFKSLHPSDLTGFLRHGARSGSDLAHVDSDMSRHNRIEIGSADAVLKLQQMIPAISAENHANEIAALIARSRQKDAAVVELRGPADPWRSSKHGPLREGILSARADWFGGSGFEAWDLARVEAFRRAALTFLQDSFSTDQLLYVRSDSDEEAFHLHFLIAIWVDVVSNNRGRQRLLQASGHPLLRDYEMAQTQAAQYFKPLGLARAERRAEARRETRAAGLPCPRPVQHVPASRYRAEEKKRGQELAGQICHRAGRRADEKIEAARITAKGTLKAVRKRADAIIREAETKAANHLRIAAQERQAAQELRKVLEKERKAKGIFEARLKALQDGLALIAEGSLVFDHSGNALLYQTQPHAPARPLSAELMDKIRRHTPEILNIGRAIEKAAVRQVAARGPQADLHHEFH